MAITLTIPKVSMVRELSFWECTQLPNKGYAKGGKYVRTLAFGMIKNKPEGIKRRKEPLFIKWLKAGV